MPRLCFQKSRKPWKAGLLKSNCHLQENYEVFFWKDKARSFSLYFATWPKLSRFLYEELDKDRKLEFWLSNASVTIQMSDGHACRY